METFFRRRAIGSNKRTRTRGVLIDSAVEVFADKGVEAAKINEIAAIAGLANGTFYNHFKDKDELAATTAAAIALEIASELDRRMADLDAGVSRIVAASYAFLRLASLHAPWGAVLLEQYQRRPSVGIEATKYMRADIALAVEQRQLDVTVDDFLLGQLAALMMMALRVQLEQGFDQYALERTCENLLRVLGQTPDEARQEIAQVRNHELFGEGLSFETLLPA